MMTLRLALMTSVIGAAAYADDLQIVTDFAVTQSLVAQVTGDVPVALLPPGASAHDFALRPSDAQSLSDADVVIWAGHGLTPWLEGPVEELAADAASIELLETAGWDVLALRDGHDHDHGHDGHVDPHAWLDPQIAAIWTRAIAEYLSVQDPDHAADYTARADAAVAEYAVLVGDISSILADVDGSRIVFPHDSTQYLEAAFGLTPAGFLADSDAARPGAAHITELREMITSGDVTCVMSEAETDPGLITLLTEGTDAKTAQIDITAAFVNPGAAAYGTMMRTLATTIAACAQD